MYVSYFHSDKLYISAGYFDALVTGSSCVTSVEFSRPLAQILDPIHKCSTFPLQRILTFGLSESFAIQSGR
jgi:hypothetical protein